MVNKLTPPDKEVPFCMVCISHRFRIQEECPERDGGGGVAAVAGGGGQHFSFLIKDRRMCSPGFPGEQSLN